MTNLSNRSNRPDLIKRRIGQRQSLRLKKFIAACVTCFLCFSCENEAVYDQYQAIQNTSWEKDKEYYFTFLIKDISIPYVWEMVWGRDLPVSIQFPDTVCLLFPVKGQYTFSFRQGMRNDQLPGIQEIGLRVLPSSTNAPSEKRPNEEK